MVDSSAEALRKLIVAEHNQDLFTTEATLRCARGQAEEYEEKPKSKLTAEAAEEAEARREGFDFAENLREKARFQSAS